MIYMKHIMITKTCSFMKDNFSFSKIPVFFTSALCFLILLDSCAPSKPSLKKLSVTEPEKVVSKQDSLLALSKERRPEFVSILSTAHINIARKSESSGDRKTALKEYKKVLAIDPKNKTARYELLVLEGLSLYKKGSKTSLWDAIEIFSKASMVNQEDGVASYWIAKSYEKKDNKRGNFVPPYDLVKSWKFLNNDKLTNPDYYSNAETVPLDDFKFPAIKLNNVVFPDPLGPIIPVMEPFLIFSEQSDTAAKPPKYLESLSTCRIFESERIENYTLFNLLRILFRDFSRDR